jgi:hypothetical protein
MKYYLSISHVNTQLEFSVSETVSLSMIRNWCNECHLSGPHVVFIRTTQHTLISATNSIPTRLNTREDFMLLVIIIIYLFILL